MLVLSRNENEDIIITPEDANGNKLEPICVKLVSVDGKRAKIGVDAPKKYTINRREIQAKLDSANKQPQKQGQKIAEME